MLLLIILIFGFGPFLLWFFISAVYGIVTKAQGNNRIVFYFKYLGIPLLFCNGWFAYIIHGWNGFPDGTPGPFTLGMWTLNFIRALPFFIMLGILFFYFGVFLKNIFLKLRSLF
jgi:hypothetical protein